MDFKELGTNCLKLWFQEKSREALGAQQWGTEVPQLDDERH